MTWFGGAGRRLAHSEKWPFGGHWETPKQLQRNLGSVAHTIIQQLKNTFRNILLIKFKKSSLLKFGIYCSTFIIPAMIQFFSVSDNFFIFTCPQCWMFYKFCTYLVSMVTLCTPGLHDQLFESAKNSGNSYCYCWSEKMINK